eukprot:CAMPEP_0204186140 /NCGR_PEP_ID=MMETSP0361-20130328/55805_1 /ASSEMBLY_ACC=CAM_ASM_000343 /TAXON_ID=268821 /ORGANISM="Scrippsiella Hangoei, Strain SHTV-5" /LENGTH=39 /DNA_ID= /DNA_START= /DNA_END= /DNA_ORIENTATION=
MAVACALSPSPEVASAVHRLLLVVAFWRPARARAGRCGA